MREWHQLMLDPGSFAPEMMEFFPRLLELEVSWVLAIPEEGDARLSFLISMWPLYPEHAGAHPPLRLQSVPRHARTHGQCTPQLFPLLSSPAPRSWRLSPPLTLVLKQIPGPCVSAVLPSVQHSKKGRVSCISVSLPHLTKVAIVPSVACCPGHGTLLGPSQSRL